LATRKTSKQNARKSVLYLFLPLLVHHPQSHPVALCATWAKKRLIIVKHLISNHSPFHHLLSPTTSNNNNNINGTKRKAKIWDLAKNSMLLPSHRHAPTHKPPPPPLPPVAPGQ
jgi:hypothetical protein